MHQIQNEGRIQLNTSIEHKVELEQTEEKKNEDNIDQGWSPISSVIIEQPKQPEKLDRSNNQQYIDHMQELIAMDQNQFKQSQFMNVNFNNRKKEKFISSIDEQVKNQNFKQFHSYNDQPIIDSQQSSNRRQKAEE